MNPRALLRCCVRSTPVLAVNGERTTRPPGVGAGHGRAQDTPVPGLEMETGLRRVLGG